MAATFLAAAGSSSGSSAPICTWIGLPVGGPARGAVTSTRMPGISAVAARMPSMISCAGGARPPVGEFELDDADGVFAELARAAAAARRRGCRRSSGPWLRSTRFSASARKRFFSSSARLPRRVDDDLAVVGLDGGEELDAAAELAVADLHHDSSSAASASVAPGRRSASRTVAHVEAVVARRARRAAWPRPCRAARRASA